MSRPTEYFEIEYPRSGKQYLQCNPRVEMLGNCDGGLCIEIHSNAGRLAIRLDPDDVGRLIDDLRYYAVLRSEIGICPVDNRP